ncbi:MAG TPA: hypothetical protein VGH38_00940 [Bryobacteraceae bacterium]
MENLEQFRNADSATPETAADFQILLHAYRAQFQPVEPAEENLVAILAESEHTRRRVAAAEAQLLQILMAQAAGPLPLGEAYQADLTGRKMLPELFRQIATLNRTFFQALTKLERLQQRRRTEEQKQEQQKPAPIPPQAKVENAPPAKTPTITSPFVFPAPPAQEFDFTKLVLGPELPPYMSRTDRPAAAPPK